MIILIITIGDSTVRGRLSSEDGGAFCLYGCVVANMLGHRGHAERPRPRKSDLIDLMYEFELQ